MLTSWFGISSPLSPKSSPSPTKGSSISTPLSPAQRIKADRDLAAAGGGAAAQDIYAPPNSAWDLQDNDLEIQEPSAVDLLQAGGPGALSEYLELHPGEAERIQDEMRGVDSLLGGQ